MANLSPIDSITKSVAKAAAAAQALDSAASEDLRALLRIAACEAGRLAKSSRKSAAAAKPAAKPAKKAVKAARAVKVEASGKQLKGRRKAAPANGAAAH